VQRKDKPKEKLKSLCLIITKSSQYLKQQKRKGKENEANSKHGVFVSHLASLLELTGQRATNGRRVAFSGVACFVFSDTNRKKLEG
jgi:hypothetical protein